MLFSLDSSCHIFKYGSLVSMATIIHQNEKSQDYFSIVLKIVKNKDLKKFAPKEMRRKTWLRFQNDFSH